MLDKNTKQYKLKAKKFSKNCIDEIKNLTQDVVGWRKLHVGEMGYIYYLKNKAGDTIAHVFKEHGNMVLSVKV